MSSAFPDSTTFPSVVSFNRHNETSLSIDESTPEKTPSSEKDLIVVGQIVLVSHKQSYMNKHANINLMGIVLSVISVSTLSLIGKAWVALFIIPIFLGFLEMYITVLVDKHSRKG